MKNSEAFFAAAGGDGNYEVVRTSPEFEYARQHIETMWSWYRGYADPDFLNQARMQDLTARFWEMFLAYELHRAGHHVATPDERRRRALRHGEGPDVLLLDDTPLWVEAVATSPGVNRDRMPTHESGVVYDVPDRECKLRMLTALSSKAKVHRRYRERGVVGNEPFIVAINGAMTRAADFAPPRIVRALFGIGEPYVNVGPEPGVVRDGGFVPRRALTKSSGTDVSSTPFLPALYDEHPVDESFKGVSAVIYSEVGPWSYMDPVVAEAGLSRFITVVHNARAEHLLPAGRIRSNREYRFDASTSCVVRVEG